MVDYFVYEPLSYNHEYCEPIRLLRILPGEATSLVSCELFKTYLSTAEGRKKWEKQNDDTHQQTIALPQNEEYYALSYVWGDAQDKIPVLVNGKQLLITRNLESFLQRQRNTFSPNEQPSRIFWVDAICIDQTNLEERSRQVAFMADIYKEADTVLAWLGEETPISRIAMTALSRPDADYDTASNEETFAVLKYFQSGYYWDRLWIVQELFHARRIILRSGSMQVDWAPIFNKKIPPTRLVEIEMHRVRPTERESIWDSGIGTQYAEDILSSYGSRECLDPRDSVYGLRSLSPLLMSVVPNYASSIAEVFLAATRVIISNSSRSDPLSVLEIVHRQKPSSWDVAETSHLPTWVPDWKMPRVGSLLWLKRMGYDAVGHQNIEKQQSVTLLPYENPAALFLAGVFVDTVTHVTRPYGAYAQSPELKEYEIAGAVAQLQHWLPECESAFIQETVEQMVHERTLVKWDLDRVKSLLDHYFQQLGYQGSFFGESKAAWVGSNIEGMIRLEGCTVLITKTTYTGIVLGKPEVGDFIFVAYGSRRPYVIRRTADTEESYTLVGCAFVTGLMDGEATKLADAGKLTERTICLV